MTARAPVCCQTCGAALGHLWDVYWCKVRSGLTEKESMDSMGIEDWRYCCRATLLTWVPNNGLGAQHNPPEGSMFTFRSSEMIKSGEEGRDARHLLCR